MPYDPALPSDHGALSSAQMRAQLQAMNQDIQGRVNSTGLAAGILGTALNPGGVQTFGELGMAFGDASDQALASKIDELILALRC